MRNVVAWLVDRFMALYRPLKAELAKPMLEVEIKITPKPVVVKRTATQAVPGMPVEVSVAAEVAPVERRKRTTFEPLPRPPRVPLHDAGPSCDCGQRGCGPGAAVYPDPLPPIPTWPQGPVMFAPARPDDGIPLGPPVDFSARMVEERRADAMVARYAEEALQLAWERASGDPFGSIMEFMGQDGLMNFKRYRDWRAACWKARKKLPPDYFADVKRGTATLRWKADEEERLTDVAIKDGDVVAAMEHRARAAELRTLASEIEELQG